jgi:transposase
MWDKAEALRLTKDETELVAGLLRAGNTPQSAVLRCRIVLGAAEGLSNNQLARQLSVTRPTVIKWRQRFEQLGMLAIWSDAPRSGRPKQISEQQEAGIVETTLQSKPRHATHWSTRTLAKTQGVSHATVHRIWQAYGLQPHRVEKFKLSTDPEFVRKVRDIVGLYLNPPDKALVLSVDEKSQIQALDRTAPILPLRPGLPERQTHDYRRHGTTTLFAALNVLEGLVIGSCLPRHRHTEFLQFLETIERQIPKGREVHLILDNYGTHKHPKVREWFGAHPRYRLHFTPTGASWLNLVERFFAELTEKRIRRGTFHSVRELVRAILAYIRANNQTPRPFTWTATAPSLLRKVRHCKRILETGH